ncbi:MAG: Nickel/cobalt efflux system [uncultured Sulfurovum sp.]|uniref:Nickel/cobalt efflux system n=1 Tax=uncultured Sulfurovum sp. TaxID=269237 RepID=A0A6S6S7Q7_9BACT|nr:MAG: Nickel/cobalt efflux system [uncultured Sulfurovum sp.]
MKQLSIILLLIITHFNSLHACTLCGDSTQFIKVSVNESHTNETMTLDIHWDFSKKFSAETLLEYDENGNKHLDHNEIANIHEMIMEYLETEQYLSHIKYVPATQDYSELAYLTHTPSNEQTSFHNNILRFSYTLNINLNPKKDHLLYLTFFDKGSFFSFKIAHITQAILAEDKNSTVLLDNSASFQITPNEQAPLTSLESVLPQTQNTTQLNGILGWLSQQLTQTKEKLVTLLEDIKENQSPKAYFWLLFFSLLYGIIHAIGPGHGKSLVAAYFLGNNRSVTKAFSVASLIGIVHTFSAFFLTFTIYYVLNTYMDIHFSNIETITTQISAVIIILIALYLLYKRIPKRAKSKPTVATWSQNTPKTAPQTFAWSQSKKEEPHEHSCGCGACQSESTDIGVILSAGIVPCPGTITIFIFTLSLGVYWVGLLSAIFMSIGMSLIIFIAAYLSLKMRKTSMGSDRLRKILDYGSLVFIFGLGVLLLVAA